MAWEILGLGIPHAGISDCGINASDKLLRRAVGHMRKEIMNELEILLTKKLICTPHLIRYFQW
jgi:hypothetical protein